MNKYIENVLNTKELVGIFGFGISGDAVSLLLKSINQPFIIFDNNCKLGQDFEKFQKKFSIKLIIYSPGFLQSHKWMKLAKMSNIPTISELDFGAYFWKGRIVAITGTDGKTTVTSLIAKILHEQNITTTSAGNIGTPLCSFALNKINRFDTIGACEVSSFQSENLQIFKPDYSIFINFAQDHLEKHKCLEEYFNCKWNLIEKTKKTSFIGESVAYYAKEFSKNLPDNCKIIKKNNIKLLETFAHNNIDQENYSLIESFCSELKISLILMINSVKNFSKPHFRLEGPSFIVYNNKKIEFWNDSKATNFHSFEAALQTFSKKLIIICGGKSKNENLETYINAFNKYAKHVLLIGETGEAIHYLISKKIANITFNYKFFGKNKTENIKIIKNIKNYIFELAQKEDVVLLSPGFSSLDMFSSYEERGDFFNKVFTFK